jgi:type II secretory pathway pseudopilin PulG
MRSASTGSPAVSASKPRDSKPLTERSQLLRGSEGFTLFEALIAIVILALSLSALLPSFSGGLRGATVVDDHLRARLLAQSVMAEISRNRDPMPAVREGRIDKFTWRLATTPYDAGITSFPGWRLQRLVLTVAWEPGRRIELQSLRVLRTR